MLSKNKNIDSIFFSLFNIKVNKSFDSKKFLITIKLQFEFQTSRKAKALYLCRGTCTDQYSNPVLCFYFLLFPIKEENIRIGKIFVFWFLTSLHVLGCHEYDFSIFKRCLSACVWHKFCGRPSEKTDVRDGLGCRFKANCPLVGPGPMEGVRFMGCLSKLMGGVAWNFIFSCMLT